MKNQNFGLNFLAIISLPLVISCASLSSTFKKQEPSEGTQSLNGVVGESYFDGNRAPASMSPPFDMGPDGLALDPIYMRTKADYHFTMGETYSFSGDAAKAIEEFKLTSVYDPQSAVVRLRLAVEYVKKGLLSESMVQAEEAIKINPNYAEARLLLGGVYTAIKLHGRAEEQYQYVIKNHKDNHEAYLYLGALYSEQKKYKQAIDVFSTLAKNSEYQSSHLPHYYMARVYAEEGNASRAESEFTKALQIKPSFTEGVLALGSFYEKKKRDKTLTLYESFQDKHGPNEKVAEQLSRLYLEDEKYEKAYQQLEIVVGADPENLNAKVKMALILIETKDYTRAVTRLKEILAEAPDSDKIRFFLGAVYEEIKDYKAAIEQFNLLAPNSTYYVEAVIHASYLYKLQSNYRDAINLMERAVEIRPDAVQFYPLYASYLDDTKEYLKAVKMLQNAVAKFPTNDQLHFFLGSLQDKVGNRQDTLVSMKRTIELNPEHVQALNYLAYTYADMSENLEEAYNYAKKALSLKPNDAFIQDTVGWVYYKKGNYADAVKVLETAYRTKSDESIIAEHLGDAYYKYKLPGKAKEMYKHAIKHETDSNNLEKLEAKISAIESSERGLRVPASK